MDSPASEAHGPDGAGAALTEAEVVTRLSGAWGAARRYRGTAYWASEDGGSLVACVIRGRVPVLRVHTEGPVEVRFIEVGTEWELALAQALVGPFRARTGAGPPPLALCMDLWVMPAASGWGAARAARSNATELRAWSRALHATAAIAKGVARGLGVGGNEKTRKTG